MRHEFEYYSVINIRPSVYPNKHPFELAQQLILPTHKPNIAYDLIAAPSIHPDQSHGLCITTLYH